MGCITVTTIGVAQFSDPVLSQVSVGTNQAVVRISTKNNGSASGTPKVRVTVDGVAISPDVTMPTAAVGATVTYDLTITGLTPAKAYTICGTIV